MRSVTKWYSDDGKEFNTQEQCEAYEFEVKTRDFEKEVFLYDKDGKVLPFSIDNIEKCIYLKIVSDAAAEKVYSLMKDENIASPWDSFYNHDAVCGSCAGCWFWDCGVDEWKDIDLHYKRWRERMAVIL